MTFNGSSVRTYAFPRRVPVPENVLNLRFEGKVPEREKEKLTDGRNIGN